ncbi:MAG TPA: TPM domain-containing protein [Pyrinomonadaceae bacterium]|nr:TPM domain-containing protein [Pyrinomonadaceae bacterium]
MRSRKPSWILRVGFGIAPLLFAFAFLLAGEARAQTKPKPPVPLPTPFTPIVDYANVIDGDTRQRLESIYRNLKDRAGVVYSVLTVQTIGDQPMFDYSLAVARGWGIGPKDAETPSFLLVVAIQDRKYFTQVSQHLEGDLTDGVVGRIQRERLVTAFRQGNYSKGIYDTVQAFVATIAASRGFSIEGIDQRNAYRDTNTQQPGFQVRNSRGSLTTVCCGIIFVLFIVILISAASRRGRRGGRGGKGPRGGGGMGGFGGGGLLEALLWGSLVGNLSRGGQGWGSSSGWGSSGGFGGGGFGGGGGGGFGGGFGGGDSFGGGGAGGSW